MRARCSRERECSLNEEKMVPDSELAAIVRDVQPEEGFEFHRVEMEYRDGIPRAVFIGPDDEIVVDTDFAELVHDHGVFLAVRFGENAVEKRGFAGAQIAGQHRYRDFIRH